MFSILEVLSILGDSLITKLTQESCVQKQFYTPILFTCLLEPTETNFTHAILAVVR